jgi:hypothetical protein
VGRHAGGPQGAVLGDGRDRRDLDALVAHLRWPTEHRKRIRSTKLLRAHLRRGPPPHRRRTKAIGRFPGETSAVSLIWAVLELSSRGWRGVVMTPRSVGKRTPRTCPFLSIRLSTGHAVADRDAGFMQRRFPVEWWLGVFRCPPTARGSGDRDTTST